MLALYDLCAVLTPCGPLKLLVGLMQERNEPLPGLLYEAHLPPPQQYRPPVSAPSHSQSHTNQSSTSRPEVQIPSPMSLGVGIGISSLAMVGMMTNKGTKSSGGDDMDNSTGQSKKLLIIALLSNFACDGNSSTLYWLLLQIPLGRLTELIPKQVETWSPLDMDSWARRLLPPPPHPMSL